MNHRAGFVSIIGKPNAGKSTLMNAITGEKLSIITPKAQTTRHRIKAIINEENYQIVFSDTPGLIKPVYLLQKKMMNFVAGAFEDADIILYVAEAGDLNPDEELVLKINSLKIPVIVAINKIDLSEQEVVDKMVNIYREKFNNPATIPVSAKLKMNTGEVLKIILELIPECPPYFPKDQVSDLPVRFFVSEIIREKILLNYQKEIPYSVEVIIESFEEGDQLIKIRAVIFTERNSQKGIIIGHKGEMLKKVGTQARTDIEEFVGKKVYLELFVKVREGWRNNENRLRGFGYTQ